MQNISNYNKLIKNTETIIIKIKSLVSNFEKNKDELLFLNYDNPAIISL